MPECSYRPRVAFSTPRPEPSGTDRILPEKLAPRLYQITCRATKAPESMASSLRVKRTSNKEVIARIYTVSAQTSGVSHADGSFMLVQGTTLQLAEKSSRAVGLGFIPGINQRNQIGFSLLSMNFAELRPFGAFFSRLFSRAVNAAK